MERELMSSLKQDRNTSVTSHKVKWSVASGFIPMVPISKVGSTTTSPKVPVLGHLKMETHAQAHTVRHAQWKTLLMTLRSLGQLKFEFCSKLIMLFNSKNQTVF